MKRPGAAAAQIPSGSRRRPAPPQPAQKRVGLALVHHANQYLITDGYVDRQGISTIVDGYAAVLRMHERYGVPAALHLSGTLIEALAWYHPGFLGEVRRLADKGLLTLIGGAYSEAVMPLLHEEGARRSLREFLWLYEKHLGRDPGDLKICWVPERVWEPEHLPGLLADKSLANGGYEWVLLDDRLRCKGLERTVFDASMSNGVKPGCAGMVWANGALPDPDKSGIAYRLPDKSGLGVIQMSSHVRHRVPPQSTAHWLGLDAIVRVHHRAGNRDSLLVYADDMERTAGVGGWDPASLRRYDDFLKWLRLRNDVEPVHLERWLSKHGATEVTEASTGTFFELAETWKAGEEYQGWWQSPEWSDYRGYLETVEQRLAGAGPETADGRLLDLAWKHFVASMYETAWHDSHEE